jgi:hypothetical protein
VEDILLFVASFAGRAGFEAVVCCGRPFLAVDTMFLSICNVCVSPGATLLFHAGGTRQTGVSPGRTQQMLSTYNAALQQYVTAHHFMDTLDFHPISGSEIIKRFGYPACR